MSVPRLDRAPGYMSPLFALSSTTTAPAAAVAQLHSIIFLHMIILHVGRLFFGVHRKARAQETDDVDNATCGIVLQGTRRYLYMPALRTFYGRMRMTKVTCPSLGVSHARIHIERR